MGLAFLFLIRERFGLQRFEPGGKPPSWSEFAARNPDLLNRKSSSILRDYYLEEMLASELAKRMFILPNRNLGGQKAMNREEQSGHILLGIGREIRAVPDDAFVQSVKALPARMASRLAFMSRDHHVVRDFVVRELPRQDRPLSPIQIAQVTGLTLHDVSAIVAELERNLFFLVRDADGNVGWAFPVTTSETAHRLTFSTEETIFGA